MKAHLSAAVILTAAVLALAAGCGSGTTPSDDGADVTVADVVAGDVSTDARDTAGDDARDTNTGDNGTDDDGTVSDADDAGDVSTPDSGDADDDAGDAGPDVVPPPLWEGIAPTGINTVERAVGVSTHMYQGLGDNAERSFEFEKYAELGAVTIREDFHWHMIEPTDDEWNMDHVRGQVDMATDRGVKVIPMLGYENGWAMTDGGDFSTINTEEYGEYAGAVADEYCDQIKEYEIWNEENIPRFWGGNPDAEKYGDMLKAAHTAIKAVCPDARVAFGGISSYDAETDLADRFGFIERVAAAHPDICDNFEILAFHPYTFFQYDPPERDVVIDDTLAYQGQSWQTDIVRAYLASIGCPDKALMVTEQGWPSYDLSEELVGRFLPRSMLLGVRDGIERYMWYTFWDGYPTTEGIRPHESYFGLFGWTGEDGTVRRAKPAWTAFKAMGDILGDTRFARDLSPALGLPNDVYALAFMSEVGDIVVAAWDGRDFPDQFWGTDGPGGADTTFGMNMPLPEGFTGVTVHDINGAAIDSSEYTLTAGDDSTILSIALTPAVKYISFVN